MTVGAPDRAMLRHTIMLALQRVAPEVSAADLHPAKPLRDQVDLDSMDWLNFLVAVHDGTGVDIPERDYGKLVTLDDLLAYLVARLPDGDDPQQH